MRRCLKKSGFTLIELLLVTGIFTLIIGVSFTLLSTGRVSMFVNEARIQAEENARLAADQISKELRLSSANLELVHISDSVGWATNNTSGTVINFQIPVGSYDGTLDLTGANELKWGNEDTEDAYIAYWLNDNLLTRSIYTASDGSDATGRTIASDVTSLAFSRAATDSALINIDISTQGEASTRTATRTLRSGIKLRN